MLKYKYSGLNTSLLVDGEAVGVGGRGPQQNDGGKGEVLDSLIISINNCVVLLYSNQWPLERCGPRDYFQTLKNLSTVFRAC